MRPFASNLRGSGSDSGDALIGVPHPTLCPRASPLRLMALLPRPDLAFASPRKLPRARDLAGRVVVLDLAFASEASSGGFEKITKPFIDQLGPRLAGWVDHHDHLMHAAYRDDPRFVLSTKAEH